MSGSAFVQRLVFDASMRGAAGVEKSLSNIEAKGASAGAAVDSGMGKAGESAKGATSKLGALTGALDKNKSSLQAVTGAGFALTAALAQTGSGMTRVLLATGATTAALAAIPGPIGAIAATSSVAISMLAALSQGMSANKSASDTLITSYDTLKDKISSVEGSFSGLGMAVRAVSVDVLTAIAQIEAMQGGLLTMDARRMKMADAAAIPRLKEELKSLDIKLDRPMRDARREELLAARTEVEYRLKGAETRLAQADEKIKQQENDAILAERRLRAIRAGETARIERELTPWTDRVGEKLTELFAGVSLGKFAGAKAEADKAKAVKGAKGSKPDDLDVLGAWDKYSAPTLASRDANKADYDALGLEGEGGGNVFSVWKQLKEAVKEADLKGEFDGISKAVRTTISIHDRASKAVDAEAEAYANLTAQLSEYGSAQAVMFSSNAIMALIYGESLKNVLNLQAQSIVQEASMQVPRLLAIGLTETALGHPELATAAFTASAVWAGVGTVAGGIAAASGGFNRGGVSGGSTGSSGNDGLYSVQSARDSQVQRDREQNVVINMSFSGPAPVSQVDRRRWAETVAQGVVLAQGQRGSGMYNGVRR